MDFNFAYFTTFDFAYFAHFNFAYFEIEESFGLIWVKFKRGSLQEWDLSLLILCIKEVLDKFG